MGKQPGFMEWVGDVNYREATNLGCYLRELLEVMLSMLSISFLWDWNFPVWRETDDYNTGCCKERYNLPSRKKVPYNKGSSMGEGKHSILQGNSWSLESKQLKGFVEPLKLAGLVSVPHPQVYISCKNGWLWYQLSVEYNLAGSVWRGTQWGITHLATFKNIKLRALSPVASLRSLSFI